MGGPAGQSSPVWFETMDFSKLDGLIPAVVQDESTNDVLMVGFMNQEALDRTISTGFATFFSRTRGKLWTKGETSGNRLQVTSALVDCDEDTVLLKVKCLGSGNVCHTGERTCFFRELPAAAAE
jgi:phosphoribosyl-AMP cyclohydrolase